MRPNGRTNSAYSTPMQPARIGVPVPDVARKDVDQKVTGSKEFFILGTDGKITGIKDYNPEDQSDFAKLVAKEALGIGSTATEAPTYIRHMQKFGIEWEPMSDRGHMRYGPEGALMMALIFDYSNQIVRQLGIPVYNVIGTNMFNLAEKPVKTHAELFGDRLYQLEADGKKFILRYAACHQQFAMVRDWTISYRNMPFGAFEIADSYRLEQPGELLLGFRLRRMNMPDLHIFCKDMEEAKSMLLEVHKKIYEIMRAMGRDYVSLYNITSRDSLSNEQQFLQQLLAIEKKPVLVAVYPPGKNYYWTLNIEYHIIDELGRPREIGTVQIDTGNAARFGIKYTDKNGDSRLPVILHTALIGTTERFIYTLFDNALRQGPNKATLPTWVSPTQVRICPVNDRNLEYANKLADILEANNIRVDIDDRSERIQHKISESERHWTPYLIVVGDREAQSGQIPVRSRAAGTSNKYTLQEFIAQLREETKDKPFKKLPYPRLLSMRPLFSNY